MTQKKLRRKDSFDDQIGTAMLGGKQGNKKNNVAQMCLVVDLLW